LPELPGVIRRDTGIGDFTNQTALFEVARRVLAALAERCPTVIVLEDVHWADQASLDLLRYLARFLEGQRILLVVTYRDDEVTRHHSLFALLPPLIRETQATRVELGALTREDIAVLVTSAWSLDEDDRERLLDYVLAHAEGQPLFTIELLRTLEQNGFMQQSVGGWRLADLSQVPVPTLVRQVIEGRVVQLGEEARASLEVAAVIGHQVPLDVWQAVAEMSDDRLLEVLERATALHLLETSPDGDTVSFVHALTRAALYDAILPPQRRRWHRLIAETLADARKPSPDAVAHHFQQAGDHRAVDWLVRAGIRARGQSAWLSAADRFSSAAELLLDDHHSIRKRGWLLFWAGFLLRFTTGEASVAYLQEAEQAGLAARDEILAAYALYMRGSTRSIRPTPEMRIGLVELRQGVAALEHLSGVHRGRSTDEHVETMVKALFADPVPDASREFEAPERACEPALIPQQGVLINRLAQAGHYLESLELGESFVTRIQAELDETWRRIRQCLEAYSGLGNAYAAIGKPEEAKRAISTARSAFAAIGDHAMVEYMVWVDLNMVVIPYQIDSLDERADLAALASAAWTRCRGITVSGGSIEAPSHLILSELEGRWSQAWEIADEQHRSHPWKAYVAQAIVVKGRLSRYRGDPESAWAFVNDMLPEGPASEPGNSYFLTSFDALALAAHLCFDANDLDQSRAWITTRDRWLEWSGASLWKAENLLLWAQFHLAEGNETAARDTAERALRQASDPRQPIVLIAIRRFLGELATRTGDLDAAETHLRQSLEWAEVCQIPFERALTVLAQAELAVRRRHRDEARALLTEVRRVCAALDARPTLQRAEELAARVRPRQTDSRCGLSPREHEVLQLLVQGMTDREIGEVLFISHHTVMRHVSSILRKFDVDSRTAAATEAMRRDLV
jgi:DNA-binding CsgD family transcriptional regulator/tetratricopeptide (TPR) repeat protein